MTREATHVIVDREIAIIQAYAKPDKIAYYVRKYTVHVQVPAVSLVLEGFPLKLWLKLVGQLGCKSPDVVQSRLVKWTIISQLGCKELLYLY